MNPTDFQLRGIEDPRLARYATSAFPAWLWSIDGTRIRWANPVGAGLFGATNAAELARKTFGPADPHRRQVAQLAGRLASTGAIRLERLRGFGAALGTLATCGCARLDFADGHPGVLIVATAPAGRAMPLVERLQRLVQGIDTPIATFARDGMFVGASDAARSLLGFRSLGEAGLDHARCDALAQGRAETLVDVGHLVLQRVGSGADVGLVALIAAAPTEAAPAADRPVPDYERPALSGEAPAEFALIDEFAEPDEPMSAAATPAEAVAPPEAGPHEPSPYVEAIADEPPIPPAQGQPAAVDAAALPPIAAAPVPTPPWLGEPEPRLHPLRFVWRIDADGRFSLASDEFTHLIGARTAAGLGRLWHEIADAFALDPDGRVLKAIASRNTWSGITVNWPVDGGGQLPVELSGLPVYDRMQNFAGYRGFGVCRDLDGLARLTALRRFELLSESRAPQPLSADTVAGGFARPPAAAVPPPISDTPDSPARDSVEISPPADLETSVDTPKNVLPFRPVGEPKSAGLTPVENSAFDELARQLSARLGKAIGEPAAPETAEPAATVVDPPVVPEAPEPAVAQPRWLAREETPARGESRRDRTLFDLLPVGVLIYRLDRLLYANRVFLERMGFASLQGLEEGGGLDALYVEPGVSSAPSTSGTGTPVTISASQQAPGHAATDARLFTISWDDESALALICSDSAATATAAAMAGAMTAASPSAVGHANAEELGAILDTTAEGILMFDAEGNINACNRSAEALFGYDGAALAQRNLAELFAPESRPAVLDYLAGIKGAGIASLLDHGRDVLGQVREGGLIPLAVTMGRTRTDGPNFFAVVRDLSQTRKSESELQQARRLTDRAATAKADMLARISHEVRTPLNAIIGFAEVMIGERFGALGNERYVEYMKDIRASGEHVIAIINDLLDLSRIETGKLDLSFASQNLNDLVEQCVAVMQPQANRERIIIRTSLAHLLPPVLADARALRQITLNLIGNSIHLANAGGQVIVSTALSDASEVVLRVRDTGHGLNDNEVAAAMEPFRNPAPSDQASEGSGVSLSLTKALVEANRAHFQIKTGTHSGTLIEVVFPDTMARA
ncbi:MAG TPA: PAS domain-containing protein [Bradyrhizobium sp.]|jgi:PAS domain S-box-containing protein